MSKLREIRKERGLTIFDVAMGSKVRESQLSMIENRRMVAYPGQRKALTTFYGLPEEAIFDENGFAK